MNILVIDTSTETEFLALSVGGKIFQFCENAGISHSVTMFQNLSSLMTQASITVNDIDLIGVGIGPGSFTGIRIAVSTARMFAQILEIPLVGLKSQEIYAASAGDFEGMTILAAFDAKKSKVFGGVYRIKDSTAHEIIEPGDYTMEELFKSINNPGELLCIGDGCGKYINMIEELAKNSGVRYKYEGDFIPDGRSAVELTLRKYNESPGDYIDFNNTVPFYTRKSDAEIAKDNR